MKTAQQTLQDFQREVDDQRALIRRSAAELRAFRWKRQRIKALPNELQQKWAAQLGSLRQTFRHELHSFLFAKEALAIQMQAVGPDKEYGDSFERWVLIDQLEREVERVQELPVDSHRDDVNKRKEIKELQTQIKKLLADEKVKPADADAEMLAGQKVSEEKTNWRMLVQQEAHRKWLALDKGGATPSVRNIVDDVARWCREQGIKTSKGVFPSAAYLKTHVLGGKHWTPPNMRRA